MGTKSRAIRAAVPAGKDAVIRLIHKMFEIDGGPGSGNFGHAGRPGKRGGSAPKGGGSSGSEYAKRLKNERDEVLSKDQAEQAMFADEVGIADRETCVEAMQNGTASDLVNQYFDIMEKNGDPTPTKPLRKSPDMWKEVETPTNDPFSTGDWDGTRLRIMKEWTGMNDEEAKAAYKQFRIWFSGAWSHADTSVIDDYIDRDGTYDGEIYRGLKFSKEEYDEFMKNVSKGSTIRMIGMNSSWTTSEEDAWNFSKSEKPVFIKCVKNKTSAPVDFISSHGESEVIAHSKAQWTVLNVQENPRVTILTVVESEHRMGNEDRAQLRERNHIQAMDSKPEADRLIGQQKNIEVVPPDEELRRKLYGETAMDGGPGSGNFGHSGRPGKVGGSAPEGSGAESSGPEGGSSGDVKSLAPPKEEMDEARDRVSKENMHKQFNFFAHYLNGAMYGQGKSHDAAYSYSYHGDVLINNLLRQNKPRDNEQQTEWKENIEQTKEYIGALTEACDRNKLSRPAVVFRGIDTDAGFAKLMGIEEENVESLVSDPDFAESLIGQTFSDPAFVSTSIDPEVPKKSRFVGPCEMEIFCPKGTRGLYFGDQVRIHDEHEYLLQRGTQFVITGAEVVEENPGFSPKSYHLKLQVSVVDQVPKDVPEKYVDAFKEVRPEVMEHAESGEKLSKKQLAEFFPNVDPIVISELNRIRNKDDRSTRDTHRIWALIACQRELNLLDDTEAAELESIAMKTDRSGTVDSYRHDADDIEYKIGLIEKGEYPHQKTVEKEVKESFPEADGSVFPLLVIYQRELDEVIERYKKDFEIYGENFLSKGQRERILELENGMKYIAGQKRKAG